MLFNPVSPVWLMHQGLENNAKTTIAYLHGEDIDCDSEILKLRSNIKLNILLRDKLAQLFRWKVLKPILTVASVRGVGRAPRPGGAP